MIRALALTGPTASGKTALAIRVAGTIGAEILCCDSMQIYRRMNIGTAKPTAGERAAVPHHLTDFLDPGTSYSAAAYREDAMAVAADVCGRGRIPLFVGGTGLYLDALLYTGETPPASDPAFRERYRTEGETAEGRERLYEKLRAVDPDAAALTHPNNLRRVLRALEIYETTGVTKTVWDARSRQGAPDLSVALLTLDFHDRENLYRRADARVDAMIAAGLPDEVRTLWQEGILDGKNTASQAIGYKELLRAVRGEESLNEAIDELKKATRHYAKRQLTWFRAKEGAYRLYLDREDGAMRGAEDVFSEALGYYGRALC